VVLGRGVVFGFLAFSAAVLGFPRPIDVGGAEVIAVAFEGLEELF
jgi:hypothetical protein